MEVKSIELGPILGHTTDSCVKVWAKAPLNGPKNIYLVARLICANQVLTEALSKWPVSNNKSFNNGAGVVELEFAPDLIQGNNKIYYEIGCVEYNGNTDTFPFSSLDWQKAERGEINTGYQEKENISFLLGSCRHCGIGNRYPYHGDVPFKTIVDNHLDLIDFNIMVGDQIYSDFNDGCCLFPNNGAVTRDDYFQKYKQAYSLENYKKVVRDKPTYMMLDDHELWNSFYRYAEEPYRRDPVRFKAAISSYLAHQALLSPNSYPPDILEKNPFPDLDYTFERGPYRFFALDLRSKRNYGAASGPMMIDEKQERALLKWIQENKSHSYPKFIISSIPIIPDLHRIGSEAQEKWTGFSKQRKRIVESMGIRGRFIFLSGDLHASYVGALLRQEDREPLVYNIVSSSLSWPLIGLQNWHFIWNKRIKEDDGDDPGIGESGMQAQFLGPRRRFGKIIKTNNYAIISVSKDEVIINYYKSANGKQIGSPVIINF